jgi:hypothetical protein
MEHLKLKVLFNSSSKRLMSKYSSVSTLFLMYFAFKLQFQLDYSYKYNFAILAKMEATNGPSQKVFGFLKQMMCVPTLLCIDFILEIWTAIDLFYYGQTKQGIETTALIFAPFVAKVSG